MLSHLAPLYESTYGAPPADQAPLPGDGSQRQMVRLYGADGSSVIGVFGPDPLENQAFLSYARSLRAAGLPVPQIHGADEQAGVYLVDDLGDRTLFDEVQAADGFPEPLMDIYRSVLSWLPRFQVEGGRAVDYGVAYPQPRYDAQSMQWDCNYFKYDFLKLAQIAFHEARLEEDFRTLIAWLEGCCGEHGGGHFMYRDLQSRNVMVRDGQPWFIDFQGGLEGPLQFDVAKLLYEGKAALPQQVRDELLDHYLSALAEFMPVDREQFLAHFRGFVVLRILQGLGAYGLLGLFGRKPQFIARIPHAIRDLEALLETGFLPLELPELRAVFERLIAHAGLREEAAPATPGLTVRIQSFSYKRGLPEDEGGHGGGYAFDCRGLPNPGRYAEYAGRSGLEPEVVAWLEEQPATTAFFEHALGLVRDSIDVYRERGFDSLQVLFGCTGGQHRSVYMSERLSAELRATFPDIVFPVRHAESIHWPATAQRQASASWTP